MPVRVGVPVQRGEHRHAPVDDEPVLVRAARKRAEEAPHDDLALASEIRRAPRRVQALHQPGPAPGTRSGAAGVAWLMSSFNLLPGLKYGTRFGGTMTFTPLRFGLRAMRAPLWRSRKLPKPLSSIFS